jgi:hypothetical protein
MTSPVFTPIRIDNVTSCSRRSSGLSVSSLDQPKGGAKGSIGVVLVRRGNPERRHHRIADELLDRSLLGLDLGPHGVEVGGHDVP